jgi:hypothetical protein
MKQFIFSLLFIFFISCTGSQGTRNNKGSTRTSSQSANFNSNFNVNISNACICKNKNSIGLSFQCEQLCQSRNPSVETLYIKTELSSKYLADANIGNISGWCSNERELSDGSVNSNPSCAIEAENEAGISSELEINISNSEISANVSSLASNQTYILRLLEKSSIEYSNSLQIFKTSGSLGSQLPLLQTPVARYNCTKSFVFDQQFIDEVYYLTYFFVGNSIPDVVPAHINDIKCHDYLQYPLIDSSSFPRLNLYQNAFTFWSHGDPRFIDQDETGEIDINEEIALNTNQSISNIFFELRWPNQPVFPLIDGSLPAAEENPLLGFVLNYFNDSSQGDFCPKQSDFNGNDSLLREIGKYVSVDTEGIYIASRTAERSTRYIDGQYYEADPDILLINETTLKRIWFTKDFSSNNIPIVNSRTLASQGIYFNWPIPKELLDDNPNNDPEIDTYNPLIFNSTYNRSTYKLQDASRAYDKRLGCIPRP